MTKHYKNFYETTKEANMRLRGTIILYDGIPYYVLGVSDHKSDGIFRIYLDNATDLAMYKYDGIPQISNQDYNAWGVRMDKFMETTPQANILRKQMNSPLFNRFRPFPLGMVNIEGTVAYTQRHPTRRTEQGLTDTMLVSSRLSLSGSRGDGGIRIPIFSKELMACIVGQYPSYVEVIENLYDPAVTNLGAAFHRDFAVLRGPLNVMFLAYKNDVIGVIDSNNIHSVRLDKKFVYCKEVVESLNLFSNIYF